VVSFIVPAYNEELLIGRALQALRDAGSALGQPFEMVVADDASTDRTAAIAREHGARVVAVANRQIAATRNAGARAAHGEMFVFVDAVFRARAPRAAAGPPPFGGKGGSAARRIGGVVREAAARPGSEGLLRRRDAISDEGDRPMPSAPVTMKPYSCE
jgi:glycosyltransferase involved in cell wall biosynthesis